MKKVLFALTIFLLSQQVVIAQNNNHLNSTGKKILDIVSTTDLSAGYKYYKTYNDVRFYYKIDTYDGKKALFLIAYDNLTKPREVDFVVNFYNGNTLVKRNNAYLIARQYNGSGNAVWFSLNGVQRWEIDEIQVWDRDGRGREFRK